MQGTSASGLKFWNALFCNICPNYTSKAVSDSGINHTEL